MLNPGPPYLCFSRPGAPDLECGFPEVGFRERYGHLNGVWHDVILLERRSASAGGSGLPTRSCN